MLNDRPMLIVEVDNPDVAGVVSIVREPALGSGVVLVRTVPKDGPGITPVRIVSSAGPGVLRTYEEPSTPKREGGSMTDVQARKKIRGAGAAMSRLRRALFVLCLVLLPGHSWAAMALISGQANCVSGNLFAGTNAYIYTYPAGITAGNLVVISVGMEGVRNVSSVAGTGTTYSINGANTNNAGAGWNHSMWKGIASGSDTTATITLSGATTATSYVCFLEFSGADSDQSGSTANGAAPSTTQTHASGSVTPPTANNVVVAAMVRTPGTWTEDAAFTHVSGVNANGYFGYLIQSSAAAQEFNATSVDNEFSTMRIGAFAGAGGGSSGPPPGSLMLLGVGR